MFNIYTYNYSTNIGENNLKIMIIISKQKYEKILIITILIRNLDQETVQETNSWSINGERLKLIIEIL